MSTTVNNVLSFMKECKARLKGNTEEAMIEKNYRKASSALKGQIAALESKIVNAEDAVEEAKEKLAAAKYPEELILSSEGYIAGIKQAQALVDTAEQELKDIKLSIEYYTNIQNDFNKEV